MDFYRRKAEGARIVDKMWAAEEHEDIILFKVQTELGLSRKFVRERIELLDRAAERLQRDKKNKNTGATPE